MTRSTEGGHSTFVTSSTAADLRSQSDGDSQVAQSVALPRLDDELKSLYVAHAPLVWRSLRRLGVTDAQLDDAVQDVFLVVYRRFKQFEERSSIKTWIVGITVKVAKDYRRTQMRHLKRIDRLATWLASDGNGNNPLDATERREANQLVHDLLATLPDNLREVLVLVELEEFTVREASEALGIRSRTCQRRLRSAVEAMSAAVANYLKGGHRSCP